MEFYDDTSPDLPDISKMGSVGWLCIAGFVAAFDYISKETLSSAFRRGLENDRTRPLVLGAFALTGAHLCGILPDRADPFTHLPRMK